LEQQDPPLRTWWRPLLVAGHSPFISHKVAAVRAATVTVVAAVVVVVVLMVGWLVGGLEAWWTRFTPLFC